MNEWMTHAIGLAIYVCCFICKEPDKVLASLDPKPSTAAWSLLREQIARRLTPTAVKLRADIELRCFTDAGIGAIKRARC